MKIKTLWIQKYQKYSNQQIIFCDDSKISQLQGEIFGNMNVLLFSGENGAGKTTILSFISYIFRYLQRYRERLQSDYILSYETSINNNTFNITLKKENMDIYIFINKEEYYIKEYKLKPNKGYYENLSISNIPQVTYDEIKMYLPPQIFVLGFDNAYNKLTYNSNYIGDRLVEYRDISFSYSTTSRGNYNSSGIVYLYYKVLTNAQLRNLFKSLGLELCNYVDIHINVDSLVYKEMMIKMNDLSNYSKNQRINKFSKKLETLYYKSEISNFLEEIDSEYNERFWIVDYLKNNKRYNVLVELIDNGIIYINEFYIHKNGYEIAIKDMSTGEKSFLFDLFAVCSNIKENSLIIWEEPDEYSRLSRATCPVFESHHS